MAALPIIELRGAIPFGYAMGLPIWLTFSISVLGNILPVPFIILFIRKIFHFLSQHWSWLAGILDKIERRTMKKANVVYRYQLLGLCIIVAIPFPGTGAWTGSLLAALLDIRLKNAVPAILLSVIIAGIIVSAATYGMAVLS